MNPSDPSFDCGQGPANVGAIGALVDMGANLSAVLGGPSLETPLHIAARAGRTDIVAKLIARHVTLLSRTKVIALCTVLQRKSSNCSLIKCGFQLRALNPLVSNRTLPSFVYTAISRVCNHRADDATPGTPCSIQLILYVAFCTCGDDCPSLSSHMPDEARPAPRQSVPE